MRKTFYINGRFLLRKATGVDRYADELLRVLDHWVEASSDQIRGMSFELLLPEVGTPRWLPTTIPVKKKGVLQGHAWEQIELAYESRRSFLINLCNTAPIIKRQQLTVIHDATPKRFPSAFSHSFRWWYSVLIPVVAKRSRFVATVSQFSAREIVECYGVSSNKVHIVPNSAEHMLRKMCDETVLDRFALREKAYLLAVATRAKHKNLELLGKLIQEYGGNLPPLVVVGGNNDSVFASHSMPIDSLIRTGYLTDAELKALYQHASCFIFPSQYEGFGIPPLEAMQLGCPVVSSSLSAMPEVLADGALFFEPTDVDGLYNVLCQALEPSMSAALKRKGLERARQYSWESSAEALVNLCREAMPDDRVAAHA